MVHTRGQVFDSEPSYIYWQGSQKLYAVHKHNTRGQSYKLVNFIEISWDQDITCLPPEIFFLSIFPSTPSYWWPKIMCALVILSSLTVELVNSYGLNICLNLSSVVWPIIYWTLKSRISFSTFFLVYPSKLLQHCKILRVIPHVYVGNTVIDNGASLKLYLYTLRSV